jgi:hypothetical protein
MILIDLNQVMISSLMSQVGSNPNAELSEDLIRHMVLSSVLSYKKKFSDEYGNLVFCADDKNYWRKKIFPFYKANRKKARDASKFDWNMIFNTLNRIRSEIKEVFPYSVIQVESAEADDIIATLCKYTQTNELKRVGFMTEPQKVLILSGDKDFLQLQKYSNVRQFSPLLKKYLTTDDPKKFLMEHIINGDSGDGVPNFLSQDSVFLTEGVRQKPIRKVKLEEWLKIGDPEKFCDDEMLRNYKRNESLINLDLIPTEIQNSIVAMYETKLVGDRKKMFSYFVTNKLKYLMDSISEF